MCNLALLLAALHSPASSRGLPSPGGRGPSPAERDAGRAISGHAKSGRWKAALGLLRALPGNGVQPNAVHYNGAISACGRGGQWSLALRLLSEMIEAPSAAAAPPPDSYSFTSTISALQSAPDAVRSETTLRLLRTMRELGLPPSTAAHNAAIRVLGVASPDRALALYGEMRSRGPPRDAISLNSAMQALNRGGGAAPALSLLSEAEAEAERSADAPQPDVVTYSSCMAACRSGGEWEAALRLLARMRAAGVRPNEFSYSAAIAACETGGQWVRRPHVPRRPIRSADPPTRDATPPTRPPRAARAHTQVPLAARQVRAVGVLEEM